MGLKPEAKVTLKLAGIGSFWRRVSFVAYFQILSTIKRTDSSSWSPSDDRTGLTVVLGFFSCLCTFLYIHYSKHIVFVRPDFLQNVMYHRRELLLSSILVI